jgi:hypothetical protein
LDYTQFSEKPKLSDAISLFAAASFSAAAGFTLIKHHFARIAHGCTWLTGAVWAV